MTEIKDPREGWTSASAAPFDALCPGRHLAQKGLPDTSSKDSDFGTKIHQALAKQDGTGLELDEFDIFESCQKIEEKVLKEFYGAEWEQAKKTAERERRLWMEAGKYQHSGQLDVSYAHKLRMLVVEYKTLPGQIASSPSNLQLRDQVVLKWIDLKMLVAEAGTVVIQPLITHSPSICTYLPEDIKRSHGEMVERIIQSNLPGSRRFAGTPQCDYCKAKSGCSSYHNWAGSKLPVTVGILGVPVTFWTPDQRAIFLENRAVAQRWLDTCEAEIKRLLEQDRDAVPGWCLEDGDIRETITDPQAAFDRFAQAGGQLADFMKCISIAKGKLKAALAKVSNMKGQQLDQCYDLMLAGLVEKKRNAKSLARKK